MNRPPLPAVLLSGYLGSGKTSFLNRILTHAEGRRIAVLVNDFGSVNVDAGLIDGASDGVVALQNGCICCSLAAGLQVALYNVLKRKTRPDLILIEASGVSNPGEIAQLMADEAIRPHVCLELVVTLVDCENWFAAATAERQVIFGQVRNADVVILAKTDLVDAAQTERVRNEAIALQPNALMLDGSDQHLTMGVVFGPRGERGEAPVERDVALAGALYRSWTFRADQPLLDEALHKMLSELPEGTVRGKGLLHLAKRPDARLVFQMVGRRAKVEHAGQWGDTAPCTEIIFIALRSG